MEIVGEAVHQYDRRFLPGVLPSVQAIFTASHGVFCECHLPYGFPSSARSRWQGRHVRQELDGCSEEAIHFAC